MPGRAGRMDFFTEKYPQHPAKYLGSIGDIINSFDAERELAFYYPSVPHLERDQNSLLLLQHFPKSIVLVEKPSHNTAEDAHLFA